MDDFNVVATEGRIEWEVAIVEETLGKLEPGDGDSVFSVWVTTRDDEAAEVAIGAVDLLLSADPEILGMNKAFQGVFVRRVEGDEDQRKWRKFRVFIDWEPEFMAEEAFGEEE